MAIDSRKRTFGDAFALFSAPLKPRPSEGHRKSNISVATTRVGSRTSRSATSDVPSPELQRPKLPPATDHYAEFQEQVHAYKQNLVTTLNDEFKSADTEITRELDDLSDDIDKKCAVTERTSNFIAERVADDCLQETVNDGQVRHEYILGEQIEHFRTLYLEKKQHLKRLSAEYEAIQRRIVEIAIVVLGEDDVRIGVRVRNKEQNTLGIDEAAVIQERNTFQDTYDNALQRLVEFGPEITECAEKALEGNEKIVKALRSNVSAKKKQVDVMLQSLGI